MVVLGKVSDQSDFIQFEPGSYRVRVRSVVPQPPSKAHPEYGPGIKWTFDLIDPADADLAAELKERGQDFTGFTSAKLGVNNSGVPSKFRAWVQACIGQPLADGEDVTDEMLVGRVVDAVVEQTTDDKGVTRSRVEKLVGVRTARRQAAPAAAPVAVGAAASDAEPF